MNINNTLMYLGGNDGIEGYIWVSSDDDSSSVPKEDKKINEDFFKKCITNPDIAKKTGASIADTIILAGNVGLEKAIKKGGSKIKVPFLSTALGKASVGILGEGASGYTEQVFENLGIMDAAGNITYKTEGAVNAAYNEALAGTSGAALGTAQDIGVKGREVCRKHFNPNKNGQNLRRFLEEILV